MTTTTKPNIAFWIIGVIALLWNLSGAYLWFSHSFLMTEEMMAALPPEEVELMNAAPTWNTIVYGIATIGAVIASVLLLMRKKLAVPLFGISLITVLVIQFYWVFSMDSVGKMAGSLIMPVFVIAIAIFEYFYSKGATQKGWIA